MSAALGSLLGALTGTSPVIIANESTAGVVEGGRTGLTAIVVAVFRARFMTRGGYRLLASASLGGELVIDCINADF